MLISALMMVLFANHMDERLAEGKSVIRCGGRRARGGGLSEKEKEPLLVNSQKEKSGEENCSEDSETSIDDAA